MSINEEVFDRFVRHMHMLERYKSGEVRRILKLLDKADRDLVETIAARLSSIEAGANLSAAETARLERLIAEIRKAKEALGAALYETQLQQLEEFAQVQQEFAKGAIEVSAAKAGITVELERPSVSLLRAAITEKPFDGKLLEEWYATLTVTQTTNITAAIRKGIAEGQTTDQIIRRVRGSRALQYRDGVLQIGRNQAAAVVRTAIAHVANQASEALYAENEDIIQGVQWVSTLDSRTTAVCRARDGQVFKVGQGPRPPAHPNCRSTTIPYLGVIEGTRASAFGPVPRAETYQSWLRKQSKEFQEEVLGVEKARLFREEKYSLDRFVDETGKEYTLDQLRRLAG
ncbi:minor capsid protein [Methylobacterium oryzae]|uniref:minor capsid protein n=1 Tax=Methylobacterium oryzae TaxID=334852 RepID=UPI002F33700D